MNDKLLDLILKLILSGEFYINLLDEATESKLYHHTLKQRIKSLTSELEKILSSDKMLEFYKISDYKLIENNTELKNAFFTKLAKMSNTELEEFMINNLK